MWKRVLYNEILIFYKTKRNFFSYITSESPYLVQAFKAKTTDSTTLGKGD